LRLSSDRCRLSPELESAFPQTAPADRPLIINPQIELSNHGWLVGFTSGEGCFFVNILKSKSHSSGFQVVLVFQLTQHLRDEQLMTSLINYFSCGNIYTRREAVDFRVEKFSDQITKIIPFF
jgi:hypothetical protein